MTNQEYVAALAKCKGLSLPVQGLMLKKMDKYTTKWWLTLDYKQLAYFQLFEDEVLLCDYKEYRYGLDLLFSTMVTAVTLQTNKKVLKDIARKYYAGRYGQPESVLKDKAGVA